MKKKIDDGMQTTLSFIYSLIEKSNLNIITFDIDEV